MAKEDILLTFDLNAFKQGIQKASQAVSGFVRNTTKTVNKIVTKIPIIGKMFNKESKKTKKTADDTSKGILKSFGKLALIGGLIAGSIGLIKKAISTIPEIGMTFKAVGDIVTKNLLWPLRQELIPVLQKVLDWTRDNRAMFVKWGGVVVNVFKSIKVMFGVVLNLVKTLTKSLMDNLRSLVNFAGKDITEIINVLVFKLTALFLILEAKLEPVFEFIGKGIAEISNALGLLFKELEDIGVFEAFYNILQGIVHILSKILVSSFEKLKTVLETVKTLFSGFLEGIKNVEGLSSSIIGLGEAYKDLSTAVGKVLDLTTKLFKVVSDKLSPALKALGKTIGGKVGEAIKFLLDKLTGIYTIIEDLINLTTEKIEEKLNKNTSNNPISKTNIQDTIIALKRPDEAINKMQPQNQNINITIPGINVNVTEGNAKQAGINFGMGLEQQIRQIYLDQKTAAGER